MEQQVVSVITALVSAVIGGLLAVWGTLKAVREIAQDLEKAEIRKERVNCLAALCGSRFAITEGTPVPLEWQCRYVYELNRVPVLWCEFESAVNCHQRFLNHSTAENFVALLRVLSESTKLNLKGVRDDELMRAARLTAWNSKS